MEFDRSFYEAVRRHLQSQYQRNRITYNPERLKRVNEIKKRYISIHIDKPAYINNSLYTFPNTTHLNLLAVKKSFFVFRKCGSYYNVKIDK